MFRMTLVSRAATLVVIGLIAFLQSSIAQAQFLEPDISLNAAAEKARWTLRSGALVRMSGTHGDAKAGHADTFLGVGLRRALDARNYVAFGSVLMTTNIGNDESFKFAIRPAYGREVSASLTLEVAPSLVWSRRSESWGFGTQVAVRHNDAVGLVLGLESHSEKTLIHRDGSQETRGGFSSFLGLDLSGRAGRVAAGGYLLHSLALLAAFALPSP